jgi:hypothetical protein
MVWPAAAEPTKSALAELAAALHGLDRRLLQAAEQLAAPARHGADDPFGAIYIRHDEIVDLLSGASSGFAVAGLPYEPIAVPAPEPLAHIATVFSLSPYELDLLLIALAPELDLRYERVYAYLQNDLTRRRPTVDLALRLICPDRDELLAARRLFAPSAPLLRHGLLRLVDDAADAQPVLPGKYLKLDERLVQFVLGAEPRAGAWARLVPPTHALDALLLPPDLATALPPLARTAAPARPLLLFLQGGYGLGRQTLAAALAAEVGLALLSVDTPALLRHDDDAFAAALQLAGREALLCRAALYWDEFACLAGGEWRSRRAAVLDTAALQPLGFLAGGEPWEPRDHERGHRVVRVALPRPTAAERLHLWRQALDTCEPIDPAALAGLSERFRLSAGQIYDAAATARSLAALRDSAAHEGAGPHAASPAPPRLEDLEAAARLHSNRALATLARPVAPRYGWDDLVLPQDRKELLREICAQVRFRSQVYETWGFDRRLALGKGLAVLFAGPSGTGKTMSAEVIAGALALSMYKIDLSTVVSKYIGETEKNLARIFAEAETSNAVLFFDEADALFGKRSEVRDAHDRYANLEIAYLLQRIEEYEGVVILATNLRKNLDEAFVRRMHAVVEFPFPDAEQRRRIWETILPPELPRDPALDLAAVAQQFDLTGGNIRNVALAAAFFAAEAGRPVTTADIVRAVRREYQKMGKMLVAEEFGAYAHYLS